MIKENITVFEYWTNETLCNEESKRSEQVSYSISSTFSTY